MLRSTTVLASYIFDDYRTSRVLVKIYEIILVGVIFHISP